MYELIQLTEHDYYFDCPAKIGLVRISDTEVVLIDSGNDKDAAKKVLRTLDAQGWKLSAILNTHSHADHIGGNRFLQDKTGCRIYACGLESAYTNAPVLEPMTLYGGRPFRELRHKFLMAQESRAEKMTQEVLPEGMKLIPLPGHCFEMCGFLTADGTAYIADCVSSEQTLEKYGIGYLFDPAESIRTLEAVKALKVKRFVPSHAPIAEDITELADLNIKAILGVQEKILALCGKALTQERLLKEIFDAYGLKMSAQQYALISSTLRSYLTGLLEAGKISFFFEENEMLWKTLEP